MRETDAWLAARHRHVQHLVGFMFRNHDEGTFPSFVSPWMENKDARRYFDTPAAESVNFLDFVSDGFSEMVSLRGSSYAVVL